jgi:predicted glycoside hydrolase/deacetylase ChbG (UPF0249 family)
MLCADDYALSPGVSRGILEALAAKRLSATCAMTNRPSWPEAARDLKTFDGRADLGLHLNLTTGAPLEPMPAFAPDRVFPKIGSVVGKAILRQLPEVEIRAEISRQIDAFEAAMGRPPDFVDGHQHVQVLPGVRRWLIDDLARRGWAGKLWLRDSSDGLGAILARKVEAAKAIQVALLAAGFAGQAKAAGFRLNVGFAGFSAFDAAHSFASDFSAYLIKPGPRHLVMCHPGQVDAELRAVDDVTTTREQELAYLLSPDFPADLARRGAVLTRWSGEALTAP